MIRRRYGLAWVVTCSLVVAMLAPATSSAALTFTFVKAWGQPGTADGDLDVPFNVATDSQGKVYTTEQMVSLERVQVFTGEGAHLLTFGSHGTGAGQFDSPESVAVAANGDVFVCDSDNHRIVAFDKSGTYLRSFGGPGDEAGKLGAPTGIALGKYGRVYVAEYLNNRIQVFTAAGTPMFSWGSPGTGNGEFNKPQEVAIDTAGDVYVADEGNDRVQKFDANGTYIRQWGTTGTGNSQFVDPEAVSCDPWGRVYVLDPTNNRIQCFSSAGTYLGQFGTPGSGNGELNVPWSVAADGFRNVFVADTWNNRVQKWLAPQPTFVMALAGKTRIETAIEIAKHAWPLGLAEDSDGKRTAIIATARNWPDALAAAPLAGAVDGPILLVDPDRLPDPVAAEIERLQANRVIAVGGAGAIDAAVLAAVDEVTGVDEVQRIGGSTRYQTSAQIADRVKSILGEEWDGTAIVATGRAFPDALAGSPMAAMRGWPILLAGASGSPEGIEGVASVVILGGEGAVAPQVESALATAIGADMVRRVAGATRYETAIEVAKWGTANAGMRWSHTAIATGANWPDALAGGALQGRSQSVMLLTPPATVHSGVADIVEQSAVGIGELRFFGGEGAIAQPVREALIERTIDPQ